MSSATGLPSWALEVLANPGTDQALHLERGELRDSAGAVVGQVSEGIASFSVAERDESIAFYREVGGARFHERASVAYAMSTLDTEVYHGYLAELRPDDIETLIVDVGGGDGRNAVPWLARGFRRIVVIDPVLAALVRLRDRVAVEMPDWRDRLLLIEADARSLPLASRVAGRVQAIEALAYLNEDYAEGLRECVRLLADGGRILVADRDHEAGLLTRLFYGGGVGGMLAQANNRDIWDGNSERVVRSRCFTRSEFIAMVEANGLRILSHKGISALSLVLGYQRAAGKLAPDDEKHIAEVHKLLSKLGRSGSMRRSHVVVAERSS